MPEVKYMGIPCNILYKVSDTLYEIEYYTDKRVWKTVNVELLSFPKYFELVIG